MTTPDLQPTQRMPILPGGTGESVELAPPGRGPNIAGFVLRLLLILILLVGALIALALLLTPTRESVVILGSDARPDEINRGEVGRTDTLLMLVADRALPRVAMVSIPRDLWVAIPAHGEERINAAFELGGHQTAKQTVSNVLGQRVDRFAVVGLQGVRAVVDAVGGVDLTVAQAIHDDSYPTDDYGYQTVDIAAGPQHMDGDIALKYARTRHQDSDFGRIARQQQVLAAVRTALMNPLNWPRLPAVVAAVSQSIKTDVTPLDAIAIGAALVRAPGEPDRLVIDTTLVNPITGQDGAFLLEARPELKPTVARFVGGSTAASVEILNGAGVAGLAGRTADRLTQRGFVIASVGDAPRAQAQTAILARPGARSAAERIATTLGVPTARVTDSATLATADIQVVLGSDVR
ncbi:MAG: LCP family protein [Chloroflexi bacterium]|nr:LCP family protein [Chloroflexota bacterium]